VWRRWLAILGIAALAITAIAVAEIASLATEGQPHGKSQTHNQYQPAYALIVQLLLGGWNWLRTFLNHDTISALAIVVTAGFTGTLWWSTKGLWETTERHGRHLRRSSRAAIRAADAAKASSDAAIAIETASLFAFDLRMVIGFIESDPEFSSLQAFSWSDVMDIAEGRQRIWLYGVVAEGYARLSTFLISYGMT
jgi:hypothetical protein